MSTALMGLAVIICTDQAVNPAISVELYWMDIDNLLTNAEVSLKVGC